MKKIKQGDGLVYVCWRIWDANLDAKENLT